MVLFHRNVVIMANSPFAVELAFFLCRFSCQTLKGESQGVGAFTQCGLAALEHRAGNLLMGLLP